jgi:hypothetical protein
MPRSPSAINYRLPLDLAPRAEKLALRFDAWLRAVVVEVEGVLVRSQRKLVCEMGA